MPATQQAQHTNDVLARALWRAILSLDLFMPATQQAQHTNDAFGTRASPGDFVRLIHDGNTTSATHERRIDTRASAGYSIV
jgi:hypothetical protein